MLQLEQEVVRGELGRRPAGPGKPLGGLRPRGLANHPCPPWKLRACWCLRTASELLEFGASAPGRALHKPPVSGKGRLMLPVGPSGIEEQSMFPVCLCSHAQSCPSNLHSQLYFNKTRMKVTEIYQKTKCLHRSLPALTRLVKFSHSVMSDSVTS